MKTFLKIFVLTLVASIIVTIGFWNFGLARRISPHHPMLVTAVFAAICAMVVQALVSHEEKQKSAPKQE